MVLEDYFKPFFKNDLSEKACGRIMRGTVIFFGLLSVAMVYLVQHLGQVLQLAMSIPSTCAGSLFGAFTIGMFLPWIGKRAAFYGAITASSIMIYIVARSQIDMATELLKYDTKMTSVEGCTYNFTISQIPLLPTPVIELEKEFHHISYLYYTPLGAIITCMASFIFSLLFGFEDPNNVDPQLLAPFMRKYFNSRIIEETETINGDTKTIHIEFEMKNNQL